MSLMNCRSGFAILVLLCAMSFGSAQPGFAADTPPGAAAQTAAAEASGPLYSAGGSATCMACHNSAPVTDILQTPHAMKADARTPFGQHECESCHGPSNAHATGFAAGTPTSPTVVFKGAGSF